MTHDEPTTSPVRTAAKIAIPAAVALAGTLFVATLTFGGGWLLRGTETVEVPRAPTADELTAACAPVVEQTQDALGVAQLRVSDLERDVATKQGRVQELETKLARGAEVGRAQREELVRLRAELAETKEALVIAEAEKQQLLVDLTRTTEELHLTKVVLEETRVQRDDAREDALFNRWQDFLGTAQLEICEKGNRKKLGGCREAVLATISVDARRDRFAHCVRSGQAEPMVRELLKDTELPDFSEMIGEETKQVKGWYLEFCDPTLPERSDASLAEGKLPSTLPVAG